MKMTTTGFLHMVYDYEFNSGDFKKVWRPVVKAYQFENEESVFIREMSIAVDIPDDFDPVPKQVAALEAKKREALDAYQNAVAEINDRLSKLQAIEFAS